MNIIFSYNRPEMLSNLLDEIGHSIVIDDGSTYPVASLLDKCDYYRFSHKGKEGFWMQWQHAFDIARESGEDWFFFGPDDICNVQIDKIKELSQFDKPFALNYMNIGPPRGWTFIKHKKVSFGWEMCYVDCAFVTNRRTLELLNWTMNPVRWERFLNPNISSGVGQQMSKRFEALGVPMYMVSKSLAYHGDHESQMNTEERKIHPLISI